MIRMIQTGSNHRVVQAGENLSFRPHWICNWIAPIIPNNWKVKKKITKKKKKREQKKNNITVYSKEAI